jgi:mannose/cellobiose epimerase-like protein (N-acyl-D-glucosamine 2-epimerase family)
MAATLQRVHTCIMRSHPDFRSAEFLRGHILHTMSFYDGRCVDPAGGFYHFFRDDGSVYDATTRHLVSSTRFVYTHAMAARHFPDHPRATAWRDAAWHGLRFVRDVHRDPATGHYAWLLRFERGKREVLDATRHCYGLAFVLLAHAHAVMAGFDDARPGLDETVELLDREFWEPAQNLYADEASPDGVLSPYRGQNANMHACEAFLAAFEATGQAGHLARAAAIAQSVTQDLASHARGLIWEHYRSDGRDTPWQPDWDYNRNHRGNIFRPWGFQPGHLAEWAKLLLTLEPLLPGLDPDNWLAHRARELFAAAVEHGWDRRHDGLVYSFAEDPLHPGRYVVSDGDKYFWVQAEAIAAAARVGERFGDGGCWTWYDRLWDYSWTHLVDHEHGAWFRILTPDNRKLSDEKSPAGKVDYHTMGACYETLAAIDRAPRPVGG